MIRIDGEGRVGAVTRRGTTVVETRASTLVTVQPIQGRHTSLATGTSRTYTSGVNENNSGKQRTIVCYNCKGEGHTLKQCTKPKRKRDESWLKDKVLLVQAQANRQILHEEELAFLENLGIAKVLTTQNSAKVALMANLSHYGSNDLAENSNFPTQHEALILSVIEQLKTQVVNYTMINLENESVNRTLTAELERHKDQVRILKEGNNVDKVLDSCAHMVNTSLKKLKHHLVSFDVVVKERTTATTITKGVTLPTSTSGSQPSGNTKKDKIQQTPSSAKKNKLEAYPRNDHHTAKVPLRKPIPLESNTLKPVVTFVYSRKPKESRNNVPVSKSKINKSLSVDKKEPNKSWGSTVSNVPSSSTVECRLSKLFSGTVKFGNDHVVKIIGYGDYHIGNVTISRVYFVEGLRHNLFSVGQFCDSDLEVAFRQHTCFIRNLESVDLLTGSQGKNLYTLSLGDMMATSPICLLSKASKTKTIVFACLMGKIKKKSHKPKSEDTNQEKLYLLHMDLYGPMRVKSVNEKKYILVIINDYSRFTWVKCLRSKDEAPDFRIKFLKMIQVRLKDSGFELTGFSDADYAGCKDTFKSTSG
nr:integrase, catalytic region, zinc finger, CCHC-type, peptidase aspartic, catalytic [Tanacetum cinerariifolium]